METTDTSDVAKAPTDRPAAAPPGVDDIARVPERARLFTITEAIYTWKQGLEITADLKRDAEVAEAKALLESQAKNEAARKAEATLASADLYARAEKAKAAALAAEAMVVALVGHPIGGRR
jgi:hypothetical protein